VPWKLLLHCKKIDGKDKAASRVVQVQSIDANPVVMRCFSNMTGIWTVQRYYQ